METGELVTPALVVDAGALEHNLAAMAAALPGPRLRPHVKAPKCTPLTASAMELLWRAHRDVGGELVTAGGTGTYDLHEAPVEVQAGSYALMDTAYAALGLPFQQALAVLATVISVSPSGYAVANCGLK